MTPDGPESAPNPYRVGESLRHCNRPEWGLGTVQRIEPARHGGIVDQRLWINFSNAGMKVLLASLGELERIETAAFVDDGHTLADRERRHEQGWLGQIARRRPEEAMTELPPAASDPFASLRKRLEFTIGLYRFEPVGAGLLNWAVAQSGLSDPLARFNRHELEQFFARWAHQRDAHLGKLSQECRNEPGLFESVMRTAPASAHKALRKLHAGR